MTTSLPAEAGAHTTFPTAHCHVSYEREEKRRGGGGGAEQGWNAGHSLEKKWRDRKVRYTGVSEIERKRKLQQQQQLSITSNIPQ